MPSGVDLIPWIVGLTLVVVLTGSVVLPLLDTSQGTTSITDRQTEGETTVIYGPLESTPTSISQNPDQATVELVNNETNAEATGNLTVGETITLTVGGESIEVTLNEVHGPNEATFTYELRRDAFLPGEAKPMLTYMGVLIALCGALVAAKILEAIL